MRRFNSYSSIFSNKPRSDDEPNSLSNSSLVSTPTPDEVNTSLTKFIGMLQITDTEIIDEIKRLVSKLREIYHTSIDTKTYKEATVTYKDALTLTLLEAPTLKSIGSRGYAETVVSAYLTVMKGHFAAEKSQMSSAQQDSAYNSPRSS